eukprot:m.120152 g.120152  ORF g.120152 m.120152 type:complete len:79 (+) comp14546_c0_seq2:232-468(+)
MHAFDLTRLTPPILSFFEQVYVRFWGQKEWSKIVFFSISFVFTLIHKWHTLSPRLPISQCQKNNQHGELLQRGKSCPR